MFMSSHELSLPKSISVWSWPDTNLVLRRPKDLIHVETIKTSHIKNSGWKERTSHCRNLTQISLCFKCKGSGNEEGSVSLAMCQAPAAGPEEKVDPPLCGFYPVWFQLSNIASLAELPRSLSIANLGQAPSPRIYLSYNYTAKRHHLISIYLPLLLNSMTEYS